MSDLTSKTIIFAGILFMLCQNVNVEAQQKQQKYYLAYKLEKSKTIEFDDPAKAKAHAEALRSLGIVPQVENHEGHLDITFQQPRWTLVTVAEDKLVHQWHGWLINSGFDVIHADAHEGDHQHDHVHHSDAQHKHTELVEFKTSAPLIKQFGRDVDSYKEFINICLALGCNIQEQNQNGYQIVSVDCPNWHDLECASHQDAEAKLKWFKELGFEAKHEE